MALVQRCADVRCSPPPPKAVDLRNSNPREVPVRTCVSCANHSVEVCWNPVRSEIALDLRRNEVAVGADSRVRARGHPGSGEAPGHPGHATPRR